MQYNIKFYSIFQCDDHSFNGFMLIFTFALLIIIANSLRDEHLRLYNEIKVSDYRIIPDYSEYYYYPRLKDKMAEALSVNNCTMVTTIQQFIYLNKYFLNTVCFSGWSFAWN
jgi:hypothetical protein